MEQQHGNTQLGGALSLVGAGVLLVAVFLPLAESSQFVQVADNSLIQHPEGWLVVLLALGAAFGGFQALQGARGGTMLVLIGLIAVGLAIFFGTSDALLTIESVGSGFFGEAATERASPGLGIYATGLGGLLVAAGGWQIRSTEQREKPLPDSN